MTQSKRRRQNGGTALARGDEAEYLAIERTYIGQRDGATARTVYGWMDADGTERYFAKQVAASAFIGAVYEFHERADGQFFVAGPLGPRYVRTSDDPRLPAWHAMHQEYQANVEAEREVARAKKDASDGLGDLTLRQVRDLMRKRPLPAQRAGLIAVVLRYIQGAVKI